MIRGYIYIYIHTPGLSLQEWPATATQGQSGIKTAKGRGILPIGEKVMKNIGNLRKNRKSNQNLKLPLIFLCFPFFSNFVFNCH